jgi:hypothetical protein
MPRSLFRILALGVLANVTVLSTALPAFAEESLRILVLKEHGVGSPTLAQPYLDRFVATAALQNEWRDAKGQYYVTRAAAEEFIAAQKPHYGILSLAAFLGLRAKYNLEVIGQVAVSLVGGQQYHLLSKTAADLAGCKGKRLASDHVDDPRFIENVVARGAFTLKDFTVEQTRRPLQTIKAVLAGEADCALVDDAQFDELPKIDGAGDLHSVWKSEKLPPMVVVAFPEAPTAERKRFQENFGRVCEADTKPACAEVGIHSLLPASGAEYAAVISAYGN